MPTSSLRNFKESLDTSIIFSDFKFKFLKIATFIYSAGSLEHGPINAQSRICLSTKSLGAFVGAGAWIL